MTIAELVTLIGQGGVIPLFIIILYTGVKKKWVFGWYLTELLNDRNEWKEAALHGTRVASRAVDLAASGEVSDAGTS